MSLYLPEGLRWLGWVAGAAWPDGMEDEIWTDSKAWDEASKRLEALLPRLDELKSATMSAYPAGDGAEEIGARFDDLRTGDASLETIAKYMKQISDATFDMGTEVQATKLTIIVTLCWLAAEIAWAWLFPPTAAAVELQAILTTRSILKTMQEIVQNTIKNIATRLGARVGTPVGYSKHFWSNVFKGKFLMPSAKGYGVYGARALEATAIAGGINAAIQVGQILDGKRRHFNGLEFGLSVLSGIAGSIPSREFARALGKWSDKLGAKVTNKFGWNVDGRVYQGFRGAAIGSISDGLGAVAGNIASGAVIAAMGGNFAGSFTSPQGWVGGFIQGGMVGGVRGASAFGGHIPKIGDGITPAEFRKQNPRAYAWYFTKDAGKGFFEPKPKPAAVTGAASTDGTVTPAQSVADSGSLSSQSTAPSGPAAAVVSNPAEHPVVASTTTGAPVGADTVTNGGPVHPQVDHSGAPAQPGHPAPHNAAITHDTADPVAPQRNNDSFFWSDSDSEISHHGDPAVQPHLAPAVTQHGGDSSQAVPNPLVTQGGPVATNGQTLNTPVTQAAPLAPGANTAAAQPGSHTVTASENQQGGGNRGGNVTQNTAALARPNAKMPKLSLSIGPAPHLAAPGDGGVSPVHDGFDNAWHTRPGLSGLTGPGDVSPVVERGRPFDFLGDSTVSNSHDGGAVPHRTDESWLDLDSESTVSGTHSGVSGETTSHNGGPVPDRSGQSWLDLDSDSSSQNSAPHRPGESWLDLNGDSSTQNGGAPHRPGESWLDLGSESSVSGHTPVTGVTGQPTHVDGGTTVTPAQPVRPGLVSSPSQLSGISNATTGNSAATGASVASSIRNVTGTDVVHATGTQGLLAAQQEEGGRWTADGKDLRGKSRPSRWPQYADMPPEYHPPEPPDGSWIPDAPPTEPTAPPDQPPNPDDPAAPDPGAPGDPQQPGDPQNPPEPGTPEEPGTPATPEVPGTPLVPGTPGGPWVPGTPSEVSPDQPLVPGVPGGPWVPGLPTDVAPPPVAARAVTQPGGDSGEQDGHGRDPNLPSSEEQADNVDVPFRLG